MPAMSSARARSRDQSATTPAAASAKTMATKASTASSMVRASRRLTIAIESQSLSKTLTSSPRSVSTANATGCCTMTRRASAL